MSAPRVPSATASTLLDLHIKLAHATRVGDADEIMNVRRLIDSILSWYPGARGVALLRAVAEAMAASIINESRAVPS